VYLVRALASVVLQVLRDQLRELSLDGLVRHHRVHRLLRSQLRAGHDVLASGRLRRARRLEPCLLAPWKV